MRASPVSVTLAALAAAVAVLGLSAAPAGAEVHFPVGIFGSAAQPSFTQPEEMAVDPVSGDLLVIDAGTETISRFKPNGEADPFTALGTNVIDGKGSGGGCTPPSVECDETLQNSLFFGTALETQIAVAPPGSAAGTGGDIYVTQPSNHLIDIFASDGRYLGQLKEAFNASHELKPLGEACGVAVDPTGDVYVGDFNQGIHKFVPSANPPANADNTANFTAALTTIEDPCGLAAGAAPLANGGSEGFLFATEYNGKVAKLDSSTGQLQYLVSKTANTTVSVNEATGHVYLATGPNEAAHEVREYDVSDPSEAFPVSPVSPAEAGSPIAAGRVKGVAVSPTGATSGDVYVSTDGSTHIGVWGPAVPEPPTIEEEAAFPVKEKEATLSAKIGAEGAPTHFQIQYGTIGPCSANPCVETAPQSAGSKHIPAVVSETLPGLTEGTTYYWRAIAINTCPVTCGTTNGADATFTTPREYPFELPDGRLWEMVSPPIKEGAEVAVPGNLGGQHEFSVRPQQASPDGESITYASFTSFGEAEGAGLSSQYLSRRGENGWSTEDITPTFEEGYARDPLVGFSPDLLHSAIISRDPPLALGAQPHLWNLYRRDEPSVFTTVSAAMPEFTTAQEYCVAFAGATPSFNRIIFAARDGSLIPGNPIPSGGMANLYEWTPGGGLALASKLPLAAGGGPAPPTSTTSFGAGHSWVGAGVCNMEKALLRHAISADGSRLFWTFGGSYGSPPKVEAPLLARAGGTETIQLDAPTSGVSGPGGEGKYQDASVSGSRAFFTDGKALTVGSHATSPKPDLYLYDFEKPAGSRLTDLTTGAAPGNVQGVIGADEAGDSVYFIAKGALTPAGEENANHEHAELNKLNLYAWHEGETRFIAQLAASDQADWSVEPQKQTARVSPDGRYLAFVSTGSLTGYDNKPAAGPVFGCESACSEVFRYDRQSGKLICASCNPTNQRPLNSSTVPTVPSQQQPRYLLDDGRVFFQTRDALDLNDTNGMQDVYEYEPAGVGDCSNTSATFNGPADACFSLISSGTSGRDSYFLDASTDGRDAFISTRQPLVPQLDKDTASDVYDARVNGSPPPPPPPVVCEGEGCREGGTSAGTTPSPGTSSFQDPGNPPTSRACTKGEVKRKGRCVKRHRNAHRGHHKRHHRRANRKRGGAR